ncbi:MAG: hypothetical protein R3C19_14235 [Planctomycetaceae bacterium]
MAVNERIIQGIVRNGVVVPQTGGELPEGTCVNIVVRHDEITPELQQELSEWQRAGTDTWRLIEKLEHEDQ